ncbi:MAG: RNA polymerase sigma factor [Terriglobales bacterium]
MTALAASPLPAVTTPAETAWPDARLVAACVAGDQRAWTALIARYQNLIYSIPVKQGMSGDDASEVFQSVCLSLLTELPRLRDPQALPAWLIRTTANRCSQMRRQQGRWLSAEAAEAEPSVEPEIEHVLRQAQQEQILRQAIAALPPRCRQLLSMLFAATPARPYAEIAQRLGLAQGSVSLTRSRCLERLRRHLERAGFTGL